MTFLEKLQYSENYTYFLMLHSTTNKSHDAGWKLSIQGKTLEDVIELQDILEEYLQEEGISRKYANNNLLSLTEGHEQRTKCLTIYIPNIYDPNKFAELISGKLVNYKGHYGINEKVGYKNIGNGVFLRNDRTANGEYIPVKDIKND